MKYFLFLFFTGLSFYYHSQKKDSLTLYFYVGDFSITDVSKEKIDSLMNIHLGEVFEINSLNAYCDPSGRAESNIALAKKRAESVKKAFDSYRIPITNTYVFGENYNQDQLKSTDYKKWRKVVIVYSYEKIEISPVEEFSKNPFAELKISEIKAEKFQPINLSIEFVPGEAILLNDSSFLHVYEFFEFMKYNENVHAFIRGHVCCADELILSTERANLVYMELVRRGISPKRLSFKGFSNTLPIINPELTDQDRQKNRRVDIIFSVSEKE